MYKEKHQAYYESKRVCKTQCPFNCSIVSLFPQLAHERVIPPHNQLWGGKNGMLFWFRLEPFTFTHPSLEERRTVPSIEQDL